MGDQGTCAAVTPCVARSILYALVVPPSASPCGRMRRPASCRERPDDIVPLFLAAGRVGRRCDRGRSLTLTECVNMFCLSRFGMTWALPAAAVVCLSCAFPSFPSPDSSRAGPSRDDQDDACRRQAPRGAAAFHWLPDRHNEAYTRRRTFASVAPLASIVHLVRVYSGLLVLGGCLFCVTSPPPCCASNGPRAVLVVSVGCLVLTAAFFCASGTGSHPTIPPQFPSMRRLRSVLETSRDATIVFDVELLKVKRAAGRGA